MPMYLNGSAKTGKKIMENIKKFNVKFDNADNNKYFFSWSFDDYQSGHMCIVLNEENKITNDSLIHCNCNQRSFKSTLGLYKDSTLLQVFEYVLNKYSINYHN